jgi:hypothetical protein
MLAGNRSVYQMSLVMWCQWGWVVSDGAGRDYDKYYDEDILVIDGGHYHFSRKYSMSFAYSCDFSRFAARNTDRADSEVNAAALGLEAEGGIAGVGEGASVLPAFETDGNVARVFSKRKVELAEEAKELFACMSYPSITSLVTMLRKGKIRNTAVCGDTSECVLEYMAKT